MYSYGPPHMAEQKQDDQLEHTYNSYVRIRDVASWIFLRGWAIGRSGEKGSVISVLTARHEDDDDDKWCSHSVVLIGLQLRRISASFLLERLDFYFVVCILCLTFPYVGITFSKWFIAIALYEIVKKYIKMNIYIYIHFNVFHITR